MRRALHICIYAAAAMLSLGAAAQSRDTLPAQAVQHGARMTLAEESHDFGNVQRRGGDLEWSFRFVNDGDEPLVITGVETTCTCLRYKYPKKPVAPGGSGAIDITYQPHKTDAGAFHRIVIVRSNASDGGRRMLFVQGNSLDKRKR
ncbi:MAG: DUF1573 domain-containing protein [Alistipes sp.]|nr:DUF1573 domain-containing protein [Alistipes sp.]